MYILLEPRDRVLPTDEAYTGNDWVPAETFYRAYTALPEDVMTLAPVRRAFKSKVEQQTDNSAMDAIVASDEYAKNNSSVGLNALQSAFMAGVEWQQQHKVDICALDRGTCTHQYGLGCLTGCSDTQPCEHKRSTITLSRI